jgi:hypothetical protein
MPGDEIIALQQSWMREGRNAARPGNDADDVSRTWAASLDECRPAFADQLIECLARIRDMAGFDERLRHRGPAERAAVRERRKQRVAIDRFPHARQLLRHRADSPDAIGALPFQKSSEVRVLTLDEVSEHVHVPAVVHRRNFNAWDKCDPERCGRAFDLGQRRYRVMVGHAHRADAGAPCQVHQHGRIAETVGCGRMKVEVDH